jgi:hypothetical protein
MFEPGFPAGRRMADDLGTRERSARATSAKSTMTIRGTPIIIFVRSRKNARLGAKRRSAFLKTEPPDPTEQRGPSAPTNKWIATALSVTPVCRNDRLNP